MDGDHKVLVFSNVIHIDAQTTSWKGWRDCTTQPTERVCVRNVFILNKVAHTAPTGNSVIQTTASVSCTGKADKLAKEGTSFVTSFRRAKFVTA